MPVARHSMNSSEALEQPRLGTTAKVERAERVTADEYAQRHTITDNPPDVSGGHGIWYLALSHRTAVLADVHATHVEATVPIGAHGVAQSTVRAVVFDSPPRVDERHGDVIAAPASNDRITWRRSYRCALNDRDDPYRQCNGRMAEHYQRW